MDNLEIEKVSGLKPEQIVYSIRKPFLNIEVVSFVGSIIESPLIMFSGLRSPALENCRNLEPMDGTGMTDYMGVHRVELKTKSTAKPEMTIVGDHGHSF